MIGRAEIDIATRATDAIVQEHGSSLAYWRANGIDWEGLRSIAEERAARAVRIFENSDEGHELLYPLFTAMFCDGFAARCNTKEE